MGRLDNYKLYCKYITKDGKNYEPIDEYQAVHTGVNFSCSGSADVILSGKGYDIAINQRVVTSDTSTGLTEPYHYHCVDYDGTITSVTFANASLAPYVGVVKVPDTLTRGAGMFKNLYTCSKIYGLDNLNTSNMTTMSEMFSDTYMNSYDVGTFDTSKVTSMSYMFYRCSALTSVDLRYWDVSKVTTMMSMFNGCSAMDYFNVSNWNTSSLINMSYMFCNCTNLGKRSVGGFGFWRADFRKVTTMHSMFYGCKNLYKMYLNTEITDNQNPSACTNMTSMFNGCSSMEELYIQGWDLSALTSYANMFSGCSSLRTIYMYGCNDTTISKIEKALKNAGIRDQVTINTTQIGS